MDKTYPGGKFVKKFVFVVVAAIGVLLILSVTIAILLMYVLFISRLHANVMAIHNVVDMQGEIQRVFAGVLLVLLGLELIETLKTYFIEEYIRIEVILIVAMIAVGRHIVNLDTEHTGAPMLFGIALLMLALAVSYFLIKKAHLKLRLTDRERPITPPASPQNSGFSDIPERDDSAHSGGN